MRSIQRFLVRQWVRCCQSTKACVLFPFAAQCLVLCWSDSAENCGYSAVAVHRRSSISCRSAEADSHGLARAEDHGDSAVAVCFLVVDASCCAGPAYCARCCYDKGAGSRLLHKFVEVPQWQFLLVVDVAVLCSDKLSRDSESATDSVHRRSQWTFQSPQRQVSTVAAVHGRLLAAMKGSSLQFCSIFRPPSIWTLRPRVAGTPGVSLIRCSATPNKVHARAVV